MAEELGREFFELRGRTLPPYLSADAALEQAAAWGSPPSSKTFPPAPGDSSVKNLSVVTAESPDN